MTTAITDTCKYCKQTIKGGTGLTGLDGQFHMICWREDCQKLKNREAAAVIFRDRMKLRQNSKCYFKDWAGYCENPIVATMLFCATHLAQRCSSCGEQATLKCLNVSCNLPVCDDHKHTTHPENNDWAD